MSPKKEPSPGTSRIKTLKRKSVRISLARKIGVESEVIVGRPKPKP
jgi:hypothetical protein